MRLDERVDMANDERARRLQRDVEQRCRDPWRHGRLTPLHVVDVGAELESFYALERGGRSAAACRAARSGRARRTEEPPGALLGVSRRRRLGSRSNRSRHGTASDRRAAIESAIRAAGLQVAPGLRRPCCPRLDNAPPAWNSADPPALNVAVPATANGRSPVDGERRRPAGVHRHRSFRPGPRGPMRSGASGSRRSLIATPLPAIDTPVPACGSESRATLERQVRGRCRSPRRCPRSTRRLQPGRRAAERTLKREVPVALLPPPRHS